MANSNNGGHTDQQCNPARFSNPLAGSAENNVGKQANSRNDTSA